MKKILILGASGQLGRRFLLDIENSYGTYRSQLKMLEPNSFLFDISTSENLADLLDQVKPDVVVNCIGFTNVDECQKLPEKNWIINNSFPVMASNNCRLRNIKFVQLSTDQFQSKNSEIIFEDSELDTPNHYSYAKLYAEKMIQKINPSAIIIRANFFEFTPEKPKTYIDIVLDNVLKKRLVNSFTDITFTPVSISTLIKLTQKLIEIDFSGLINISSDEIMSKFTFHDLVLKAYKIATNFHNPTSINEASLKANRPRFMALNNTKIKTLLGISRLSIYDMIEEEKIYHQQRGLNASR